MKKLLILLSFLMLFLTNQGLAKAPGGIHEYTVDLYSANGVLASEKKTTKIRVRR